MRDITHALRMFAQSPAFAFAAVAALTLGIAVNTAIFSVVNAVLLRPLPYPDADRVVYFMSTSQNNPAGFPAASPAKFGHFARQTDVTELPSAFNSALLNYTDGSFPEQLQGGRVSANFFRLLGASTILGRTFTADEDRPRGDKVAILSEAFWRTRLNSDPAVLGKAISLGGTPYTVIGVLGEFNISDLFTPAPQVWIPFQLDPDSTDGGHFFQSAGRLAPGVTLEQAQARLKASANDFRARIPGGRGVQRRTSRQRDGSQRPPVAVRARRRRWLRTIDRVRERRKPAAGTRHGAQAGDCHSRRPRRIARAHHRTGADRKRGAIHDWRHAWPGVWPGRHPRHALDQYRRLATDRRSRPYAASAAIQDSLRQSTGLPVSAVRSMADVVVRSTSRQRFNMWLMTIFGASALLLAAIGIYGLMAYTVEQRTQELGIRLSLGADAVTVRRMIVAQGMRLALAGIVIGLGASWGLAQFMAAFLFQIQARDPMVFVGVPVVLTLVAFLAVWLPAMRASRVDPVIALRSE